MGWAEGSRRSVFQYFIVRPASCVLLLASCVLLLCVQVLLHDKCEERGPFVLQASACVWAAAES